MVTKTKVRNSVSSVFWWVLFGVIFSVLLGCRAFAVLTRHNEAPFRFSQNIGGNGDDQLALSMENGSVWLTDVRGTTMQKILPGATDASVFSLNWSLDGKNLLITISYEEGNKGYAVFLADMINGRTFQIFRHDAVFPVATFSLDGTYIDIFMNQCKDVPYRYYIATHELVKSTSEDFCKGEFPDGHPVLNPKLNASALVSIPGTDSQFYYSDWEDTVVYDAAKGTVTKPFGDWYILCWPVKDYFIGFHRSEQVRSPNIYRVFLDNTAPQLVLPSIDSSAENSPLFRDSIVCSSDGNYLFFREVERKSHSNKFVSKFYITDIDKRLRTLVWSADIGFDEPQVVWPPESSKIVVRIATNPWTENGAILVFDSTTLEVTPIAGSLEDSTNINGISQASRIWFSPSKRWVMFYGKKAGQIGSQYIVNTAQWNNLTRIGRGMASGSVNCAQFVNAWSSSEKYLMCSCSNKELNPSSKHVCLFDTTGKMVADIPEASATTIDSAAWRPKSP